MTDINQVTVVGRITHNVTAREGGFSVLPSGTAKADMSIAVNRSVRKGDEWQDECSFIEVVVFGKTAENLKDYLVKGQQVAVNGSLRQDRWEKDGQKHSRVYVVADSLQLLGGRKEDPPATHIETNRKEGSFIPDAGPAFPEDIPF